MWLCVRKRNSMCSVMIQFFGDTLESGIKSQDEKYLTF